MTRSFPAIKNRKTCFLFTGQWDVTWRETARTRSSSQFSSKRHPLPSFARPGSVITDPQGTKTSRDFCLPLGSEPSCHFSGADIEPSVRFSSLPDFPRPQQPCASLIRLGHFPRHIHNMRTRSAMPATMPIPMYRWGPGFMKGV